MACETKIWLVLHLFLLVACYIQHCVHGQTQTPQVSCMFIFGDSLSDNGNNNNLLTNAKSNYKPYGIDFPTGETGRFTNGKTSIDIIGEMLGFAKFIPPYANISDSDDILRGVNYASGASGIRSETAKHMGANVALGLQILHHKIIFARIVIKLRGLRNAINYLNKCLYYVNIGSNDYINNYYLPQFYPTSRIYNTEQYAEVLISQYSSYIKSLYDFGARKLVHVGIGLIGCTPHSIATRGTDGSCVEEQNAASLIFSLKLRSLVDQLNIRYPNSKSIFVNSTAGSIDESLGFTNISAPCCPVRSDGMCVPDSTPCPNRNVYVFYDGFHPTSAVNFLTALTSYDSSSAPGTTHPMDIKQLAQYSIN